MTRITHFISSIDPRAGGPSIALEGLARAQAAQGLEVTVVSTFSVGVDLRIAERLRSGGVNTVLIGPTTGRLGSCSSLHSDVLEAITATQVAHIHGLWENIQHLAARAAHERNRPYIIRPCGMLDPWSLRQSRLVKWLYMRWRLGANLRRAAAIHFTTKSEADATAPLRLSTHNHVIVPNGIDIAVEPEQSTVHTRAKLSIPPDALVLLHLGRLHPKKGIEFTIGALAQLRAKLGTGTELPHFLVVGPGDASYRAKLERLASDAGVGRNVRFLDFQGSSAKDDVFRLSDILVLPSYQENFGMAVAEAMAAGLPVIISDRVNLAEHVTAADAGATIPLEPILSLPQRLADEIWNYLVDPARRVAAGSRGRRYAQAQFDWNEIAKTWLTHYTRLIANRDWDLHYDDEKSWRFSDGPRLVRRKYR